MSKVLIAIQARSNSTRLPNKIHRFIAGKPVLQWVIDSSKMAAHYLKRDPKLKNIDVRVCVAAPTGDPLVGLYSSQIDIVQGDEKDVLKRYAIAAAKFNSDYIVRITGDCIFLPSHLIAKHIKTAVIRNRDYTTNVLIRTFKEGYDCEVISDRLLKWLYKNAKEESDREHVTTLIRDGKPFPFTDAEGLPNIAHILNFNNDESDEKTSIDDLDDFKRADEKMQRYQSARYLAKKTGIVSV